MSDKQEYVDQWYWKHGPCCAGCDWWHYINSFAGECHKSAPVSGTERIYVLGIEKMNDLPLEAGHVMTKRTHHCGDFKDSFDWSSLPIPYRKRIGALRGTPGQPV